MNSIIWWLVLVDCNLVLFSQTKISLFSHVKWNENFRENFLNQIRVLFWWWWKIKSFFQFENEFSIIFKKKIEKNLTSLEGDKQPESHKLFIFNFEIFLNKFWHWSLDGMNEWMDRIFCMQSKKKITNFESDTCVMMMMMICVYINHFQFH